MDESKPGCSMSDQSNAEDVKSVDLNDINLKLTIDTPVNTDEMNQMPHSGNSS